MRMVRRWAVFKVEGEEATLAGGHPSQGIAAMEALRLSSETGAAHHVAEQIVPLQALLDQIDRAALVRGH